MKTRDVFIGLGITLALAALSLLAATSPDGLMRVAIDKKFIAKEASVIKSPLPDYIFPGINNDKLAAIAAAITGIALIFLLSIGLAKLIRRR